MGIENREYLRDANQSAWSFGDAPVVKSIILATVAVFLAQIFIVTDTNPRMVEESFHERDPNGGNELTDEQWQQLNRMMPRESLVTTWLQLDPKTTLKKGQVWRLLTHAFCHSRESLFHILFNMICLFLFGREMERMYGSREFLLFYLLAAIVAAFAYLAIDWYTGRSIPAIGASGAIMGVMMLFTLHYPRHMIYLFWIIPIEMRYAMALYVLVDLHPILLSLSGDRISTGIGHAAHLGGAAFGFLYYYFNWRIARLVGHFEHLKPQQKRGSPARLRIYDVPRLTRLSTDETEQVDRVLAKISMLGHDSLTDEERAILKNASNILKKKRDYLD